MLVSLPNGEAVRSEEVRRLLIEPTPAPARLEGQRFAVVLEFDTGEKRELARGLSRPEAVEFARRCVRALQEAAKQAG